MSVEDWSDHENDAVVAAWFFMLTGALAGETYNKADHNRALQELLGRSRGSIEFKLCNVSAAARAFGLPFIEGYKPRFNFQMALAEAVSRWLARHPDWQAFGSKPNARARGRASSALRRCSADVAEFSRTRRGGTTQGFRAAVRHRRAG